jgi:hypothetical protein
MRTLILCAAALIMAEGATAASPATPNDYSKADTWLCRPDKTDGPCNVPRNILSVAPDGHVTPQVYRAAPDAPIDCFYLYPTSSEDSTPNSDMSPGGEVLATAAQFGQFGSKCRQFAPIYRSLTLHGLYSQLKGTPAADYDPEVAAADLLAAWNYYLAHDNHGRGVVLIGHSQGANLLLELLGHEIEGKPVARQLVSAILPGARLIVPKGKTAGGTLKRLPLCTRAGEFTCVISYASYRATLPPTTSAPSRYGMAPPQAEAACTNPASLGSDAPAVLDAIFPKGATKWTTVDIIDTNFVRVPGLVSGRCVTRGPYRYLEITVNADPGDPRTDDIPGDVMSSGTPEPAWGLHKADVGLALGNLLLLVESQGKAWLAARK